MTKTVTVVLMIGLLLVLGCTASPVSTPAAGTGVKPGQAGPVKSDWDKLVEAARTEGTLNIYSGAVPPEARTAAQQAFKQKFGVNIEYTAGSGSEVSQKFKAEYAAGLRIADIVQTGATSLINYIRPLNVTIPIEPLLVLPEVKDRSKWRLGKYPFIDDEKHMFMIVLLANSYYVYNKNLVREGEITATPDVLNPKWKGKITMQDPSVTGNGSDWFSFTVTKVLGPERGEKFMRDLIKQDPVVTRDSRQLTEWVAREKYPIGIAPSMSMPVEFIRAGAPIAFAAVNEPRSLTPGGGVITTFKDSPHPNARTLYLNWVLSKEGSTIYAPAHGYPPTRVDVPTDAFIPALIPKPEDIMPDQEYELKKGQLLKLSGEIFGSLRK